MTICKTQLQNNSKTGQVRFCEKGLDEITPAPENDTLYRPIDPNDPEIRALAASIQEHGLREPLVVTQDGYILSGHRRYCAAGIAGLRSVPVRIELLRREADIDRFVLLLREYNRQREKTHDERLREEMLTVEPEEAYQALIQHRRNAAEVKITQMPLGARKRRSRITAAKRPMLKAIQRVLQELRPYWPVGERKVHYKLLNDPPLRHASKPGFYENTLQCSKDLSNLITRARLIGEVPWDAIGDETRPHTSWDVLPNPRQFLRNELSGLFHGYWRNLQQSQPNYLHLHVEKNTVYSILRSVASDYRIPISSGRGFSSHERIHDIAVNYEQSGKEQLILIVASDFDPSGDCIAEAFCRSLRDDYGISSIVPIKAALTYEQVQSQNLPRSVDMKKSDSRYQQFVERYGPDVEAYELEAVDEETLQGYVRDVIESVIDRDLFKQEVAAEQEDAAFLAGVRRSVQASLQEIVRGDDQ